MEVINKHLNTAMVKELLSDESPNSLDARNRNITIIEDLDDERIKQLRRLDISFNLITNLQNTTSQMPQLRHLSAYCCQINFIDDLGIGTNKLESLNLQQNGIEAIPRCFQSMNKLKELRLDGNKLIMVNHLSMCASLQTLNLAHNKLTSIDGIEGLQSLEILTISHNLIESIKGINLLPSLKELDVSFNQLTSLEGIQNLPVLEVIRANNNSITTLQINIAYNLKSIEKGMESTRKISSSVKSLKKQSTKKSSESLKSINSQSKTQKSTGLRHLNELYLSCNKLQSLNGLELFGNSLEVIDISDNQISDLQIFLNSFTQNGSSSASISNEPLYSLLTELDFSGNPFSNALSKSELMQLIRTILKHNLRLSIINHFTIQYHPGFTINEGVIRASEKSTENEITSIDDLNFTLIVNNLNDALSQSWIDEKSADTKTDAENKSKRKSKSDSDSDSDDDKDINSDEELEIKTDLNAPKLHYKTIKTIEEIKEKELNFRSLLSTCRSALINITNNPMPREFSPRVNIQSKSRETEKPVNNDDHSDQFSPVSQNGIRHSAIPAVDQIVEPLTHVGIHAVKVISNSDELSRSPRIVSNTEYSLTDRLNDPGLKLLKQRQMQLPGMMTRKSSSNSSYVLSSTLIDEKLHSAPTTPPSISIGYDVRLQRFSSVASYNTQSLSNDRAS